MGVPVETAGGRLNVGGVTTVVRVDYVRPNNTTLYTARDVFSNTVGASSIEYKNCARFAGGSGIIQTAMWIMNTAPATNIQVDLLLFDTPQIVAVDNAAYAPVQPDIQNLIAVLSFDGVANYKAMGAASGVIPLTGLTLPFKCADGLTSLHGVLVVRNGYTPAARDSTTIKLGILQD